MRTTLDLDEELLTAAQSRFPPGTPKTVVLEEALRHLVRAPAAGPRSSPKPSAGDARIDRLVAEGLLHPATRAVPPAPGGAGLTLAQILADLDADRADR